MTMPSITAFRVSFTICLWVLLTCWRCCPFGFAAGSSGSKPWPAWLVTSRGLHLVDCHTESPRCQKPPAFSVDGKALGHLHLSGATGIIPVRPAGAGGRGEECREGGKGAMMSQTWSRGTGGRPPPSRRPTCLCARPPDLTVTCRHRAGLQNPQHPQAPPHLGEPQLLAFISGSVIIII